MTGPTRQAGGGSGVGDPPLAPGSEFAGHRIEEEIGRGGMGVVYRAMHLALNRSRALKVVSDELAGDPRFQARFQREARLAASVEHPNVVQVHGAGQFGGRPYISMSLVVGSDLRRLVEHQGPLEPERAARLIRDVAAGLDAVRTAGASHRDVKPSNVLVAATETGERAVLADFGLSRLTGGSGDLTNAGEFLGSTDYVSPEQIEGGEIGPASDIYSLGGLAYFALTGRAPFAGRNEAAKLVAHVNAPRPRPSDLRPGLPRDVNGVISRAMAVDPARRHGSATEFAAALSGALSRARSNQRPSWPRFAAAALMGLLVAAGALVLLDGPEPTPRPPQDAPPTAARASASIETGDGPTGIVASDSGVLVAARDEPAIETISGVDSEVEPGRTIALPDGAQPVSVAVGFGSVWIADSGRSVLVRATSGSEPVDIPMPAPPKDIALTKEGVWVAIEDSDEVIQVTPDTNAVAEALAVCDGPRSVASGDGRIWVACIEAGTTLSIDSLEATVVGKPIPVGTRPNDLTVAEDRVWVTDNLEGVVRVVDPGGDAVEGDPIQVGARPRGVTFLGGSIWVANSGDSTVTRIDAATRAADPEPVPVGDGPADITAGSGSVWTADFGASTVTRIDP